MNRHFKQIIIEGFLSETLSEIGASKYLKSGPLKMKCYYIIGHYNSIIGHYFLMKACWLYKS